MMQLSKVRRRTRTERCVVASRRVAGGGESVKASRGAGFYEEIGKRGGHRVREILEEAKGAGEEGGAEPAPTDE